MRRRPTPAPQRGAALLVAMVLVSVVATLAAGMVWQQWKAVQIEAAERSRVQSAWILHGALDWARLILREDARSGKPTSLLEPWATPLAEARLSTFLAADKDHNSDIDLDAFLSGSIVDAQSRYNLRNLFPEGKKDPAQLAMLQRLCSAAGLSPAVATQIADGLAAAWGVDGKSDAAAEDAPLAPRRWDDLAWLGLDAVSRERLAPLVVLLPEPTPLNLNTASREVLAAVIPGLDLGAADRLVQARQRAAFNDPAAAAALLGSSVTLQQPLADVKSSWFEVTGRMRLGERVLQERSLLQRRGLEVRVVQRERQVAQVATAAAALPSR
ncbi:MAG: type II secretion system minor pseudopilin GspK [Burkholderiaceae bacterium]|nr:type II secretion system minor pseudopilin GspK [Burkholderiaceae bacterium]